MDEVSSLKIKQLGMHPRDFFVCNSDLEIINFVEINAVVAIVDMS